MKTTDTMNKASILSRVKRGVISRPQRVVLYGVESVGKTTLAAKFPSPVLIDVEGGSAHLDVPRLEVSNWTEVAGAIGELGNGGHDFKTVVIDSMDWAEKLAVEDMLATAKKDSLEDFGYGKGYTMAAERMARFLGSLDRLIEHGLNVCLIAHAKVARHEPPDGMQAYDRFELKMTRQTSPLVKEWADSLLFANFKTRVIESESGKAKGIGGKERVIYTQRSAAYDAKCRMPGIAEELPMTWDAVKPLFASASNGSKPAAKESKAADAPKSQTAPAEGAVDRAWMEMSFGKLPVEGFLVARGVIKPGQTWMDVPEDYARRVDAGMEKFLEAVTEWQKTQEVAK
jgi:hypothetical protein